jgi:alpha-L-fucosidase
MFEANWDSLNTRESPEWFADAKFGIFIHWGVYSVPAYCDTSTYAEWYYWWLRTNSHGGLVRRFHEENYGADFEYRQFAPMFRAELWQPDEWARLFRDAGARYVVLVSKHHDGFALWPDEQASQARGYDWNSMRVGPRRDLCGELAAAVRREGLKMGFYYSFLEWENPLYDSDINRYVDEHMIPQMMDLVTRYEPDILWPDGEWGHDHSVWRSTEVLAKLYNTVPNYETFVVNDRWGKGLRGHCGDYYTTEYGHTPWANDGATDPDRPFEECRGIGHSFALNRLENLDLYLDRDELVQLLIDKVSRGGGLLLNIGPTADGRVPVIQQDRLIALGSWLKAHGESIYGTRKSLFQHLPWGRSTTKGNTIYLHVFDWPDGGLLDVPGVMGDVDRAYLLHDESRRPLAMHRPAPGLLRLDLDGHHPHPYASVIALECTDTPHVVNLVWPDEHGVIRLEAESARGLAHGLRVETVQLNRPGGLAGARWASNLGYWTDGRATATWPTRVEPGRTYRVTIEAACAPSHAGGRYEIAIGRTTIGPFTVRATDGWQTYRVEELGEVVVSADVGNDLGQVQVTIRPISIPDDRALMNVRAITLTPAD